MEKQSGDLNWNGLKFPAESKKIGIFEKNNPGISVNVHGNEDGFYPLRLSKTKRERVVNLLLISDEKQKHYCVIKSLSRLLSSQVTNHDGAVVFCLNCWNHFPNEEKLSIHEEYCWNNEAIKIEMPEKGSFISFNNHNRSIKVPFVVYADFEAFTEEISSCEPNDKNFTKKYQRHKPSGFCYKIVCFDDELFKQDPVLYRAKKEDEDIGEKFVEMLEADIKRIHKIFDFSKKMIFTEEDRCEFEKATLLDLLKRI